MKIVAALVIFSLSTAITLKCLSDVRNTANIGRVCDELSSAATWKARHEIIDRLAGKRNCRESLCTIVDRWGTRDSNYDVAIIEFLQDLQGGSCVSSVHALDSELLEHFVNRLHANPELLAQVWWHVRWNARPRGFSNHEEPWMPVFHQLEFSRYRRPPVKVFDLIWIASMMDRIEFLEDLSWETIDIRWQAADAWLSENAAYLCFDESSGTYRLDEAAKAESAPVEAAKQDAMRPSTPLPTARSATKSTAAR